MDELRSLSQQVVEVLTDLELTLAVAETSAGGLLSACLSGIPGASRVFLGGVTAYGDASKEELLRVPWRFLQAHGAVSEQVALAMAEGVQQIFHSRLALAETGLTGPGGGTEEKPVGLVYLATVGGEAPQQIRLQFEGDRREIRRQIVRTALETLLALTAALEHPSEESPGA
jgi:nicotinamide-nucleotide amidase